MIELRMQNTKTLHETLIDAAKEQYGDVPIQISGNSENMTLSVDTPDEDTEKRQATETRIASIFSKRGVTVSITDLAVEKVESTPLAADEDTEKRQAMETGITAIFSKRGITVSITDLAVEKVESTPLATEEINDKSGCSRMIETQTMQLKGYEYTATVCTSLIDYYTEVSKRLGWKWWFGLTDTHYPRFFARGIRLPKTKEVIVWKTGDWKLRLWHEIGHAVGLQHTKEPGYVMHPWGFCRGRFGMPEIAAHVDLDSRMWIELI